MEERKKGRVGRKVGEREREREREREERGRKKDGRKGRENEQGRTKMCVQQ